MTQGTDLAEIQTLLDVHYHQHAQALHRLLSKENDLRAALQNLKNRCDVGRSDTAENAPMLSVGADIAWQVWVGQKKREINLELASVLSLKESHLKQVRKAYGKVLVAQELVRNDKKRAKMQLAQNELTKAVELNWTCRGLMPLS